MNIVILTLSEAKRKDQSRRSDDCEARILRTNHMRGCASVDPSSLSLLRMEAQND